MNKEKIKIVEDFVSDIHMYIEDNEKLHRYIDDCENKIKRLEYRLEISEQERIKLIDKLNDKEKANSTHEDIDKYYENEETIEEKIFEVYQELYDKNEVKIWYFPSFNNFANAFKKIKFINIEKQQMFLNIMKAVHYYIERDKKEYYKWYNIGYENEKYHIIYTFVYSYIPYYFKFSTKENMEKAKEILSNFFGINLLDWWYK